MTRRRPSLTLRARLALLVAAALVTALAAMVALGDGVYARLQEIELAALLDRDLDRVASLVRTGALGQAFVDDDAGRVRLQFVSNAGVVQLPDPGETPIPLTAAPQRVELAGRPWLVDAAPWTLPSGMVVGTLRMALDLGEAEASRSRLRRSLAASALAIAVTAGALTLAQLRRALRPLTRLAAHTATLDPARPTIEPYEGPDDEVATLAAALEQALLAIRSRQRAEREALAEVAHELAAPLTVVAGELRSLARRLPGDPRVDAARAAADELLHTSRDLLTLARGELDVPLDLEVVDLAEVARAVGREYPGVVVAVADGDARVLANTSRMRQVVRNLVRNAVQACGRHEGVTVDVRRVGDAWRTEVRDDGPGLEPDALERVFERFYSGRPGGVGVGLAVVERLARAFGGRVEVASSPGDTRFTVVLPTLDAQLATGPGDGSPGTDDPSSGPHGPAPAT